MRPTLISFDLRAGFGVFKKPDVNEGLQLTFNMLHKPALLGILGAIAGLQGYQRRGEFPEYYQALRNLRVGIEPIDHEKGNFTKTVITYTNTVGYANADGNLIVTEQTLRSPAYRCYLLPDLDDPIQARLYDRILAGEADFLPYLGKNECSAWWDTATTTSYEFEPFAIKEEFKVRSMFVREYPIHSNRVKPTISPSSRSIMNASSFSVFERLPIDFRNDEKMSFVQYNLADFAFTDWVLNTDSKIEDLYNINSEANESGIIQLF